MGRTGRIVGEPAQTLALARGFIAGKLKNSRQILLRGARESTNVDEQSTLTRVTDNLSALLRALPQAADLDTLRGIEGEAAWLLRCAQPARARRLSRRLSHQPLAKDVPTPANQSDRTAYYCEFDATANAVRDS